MSYHSQSFLCIHDTYFMHKHAIGAAEEIMLVELEADPQEERTKKLQAKVSLKLIIS